MIRILNEMAVNRREFLKNLSDYKNVLFKHICKIYFHKNSTGDLNDWLKEVTNWCMYFDDIKLKSNNKRPKKEEFLKYFLEEISYVGDLKMKLSKVKPTVYIDNEECEDFVARWSNLRQRLADYLSSPTTHSRSDYQELIKKYLL